MMKPHINMNYYSEKDLDSILDIRDRRLVKMKFKPINVCFCRDCPLFEANYWQKNPSVVSGWCKRLSYYETMEDEVPFYVYVTSNGFCNEDDIGDEDG